MTFVIVLHVLVCFLLIASVLLQPGNKGGMGAAFGGAGASTVFGGRGANTFLAKLTAGAAIVFMLTSFSLVYFSSEGGSAFDRLEEPKQDAEEAPGPEDPQGPEAAGENTEEGTKNANEAPEAKATGDAVNAQKAGAEGAPSSQKDAEPTKDTEPAKDAEPAKDGPKPEAAKPEAAKDPVEAKTPPPKAGEASGTAPQK